VSLSVLSRTLKGEGPSDGKRVQWIEGAVTFAKQRILHFQTEGFSTFVGPNNG
jgi:hypothetical protein